MSDDFFQENVKLLMNRSVSCKSSFIKMSEIASTEIEKSNKKISTSETDIMKISQKNL